MYYRDDEPTVSALARTYATMSLQNQIHKMILIASLQYRLIVHYTCFISCVTTETAPQLARGLFASICSNMQ